MTSQNELIPMIPGDILRYEREKQGLTLDRAAELSRIKPSVLIAIESGETGSIPSVYLRGYIRNYAHFLGLDPGQLDQHMAHVKSSEPEVRSVFEVQVKPAGTERWLKASSYLAASALIATLAWQFTHEAVRFSQGDSRLTSGAAVQPDTADAAGRSDGAATQPVKRHLNASIASIEMLQQENESAGKSAAEQAWAAVDSISETLVPSEGEQILQVSTSADTWVEILDNDGVHVEMDLIRAGESRQYSGSPPFSILVGRASAVRLQLDGLKVDLAPHTRGNVARMTLGRQLLSEAEQPAENINR